MLNLKSFFKKINNAVLGYQSIPENTHVFVCRKGVLFNINEIEITNKEDLIKGISTNPKYQNTKQDTLSKLNDNDIIILHSI